MSTDLEQDAVRSGYRVVDDVRDQDDVDDHRRTVVMPAQTVSEGIPCNPATHVILAQPAPAQAGAGRKKIAYPYSEAFIDRDTGRPDH